ncbi:CPBP family intramembrane glutamic endopeptidase [Bacillus sp. EB01]|uniref:CPBP family intramembrane glutamic endopeptidase n=1 Tax=Bacillus sp. EB01 TaxID=1347086 RepID=UPI0006942D8E|nr:type II CAAX endopeptidase family protein [Bacillus sp. EB01]
MASFFLIMFFMFIGSGVYDWAMSILVSGQPGTYYDEFEMIWVNADPLYEFALSHLIFVFWLIGILVSIKLIHKRGFSSLITPNRKINWKRVFWGFAVFFCLLAGTTVADFLISPGNYSFNTFEVTDFILLFVLVLFLTPIQTTTEEVFFRGYLVQWIGRSVSNPIVLAIIAGGIFGALHFSNPEMDYSAIFVGTDYLLSGVLWCYITARTNSAELAIGAHAANNMFLGWFLTMDNTVYGNIPSLLVTTNINPKLSLIWSIVVFSTFTIISLKKFTGKSGPPVARL